MKKMNMSNNVSAQEIWAALFLLASCFFACSLLDGLRCLLSNKPICT